MTLPAAVILLAILAPQHPGSTQLSRTPAAQGSKRQQERTFDQLSAAAETARAEQHDDEAIALYRRALTLRPDWDQGLWYLATLLYDKEQYADARDLFRRFLAQHPDAGPGWALLGMSEFKTREYPRALDHLRQAMSLGLGADRKEMAQSVFYFVAILLNRFEQYDDSTNLLISMVKSGQQTDLLVEPIGLAALRLPFLPQETPADRREMIQTAGHGVLALEAQQREEADRLFKSLVVNHPKEPGVHFLYGVFLLGVRPEEGMGEIKKELEISPSHVPAKLRLAEQYLKDQHVDEALALSQEAVRLEPLHGPAHMMLGEALSAKGNASEAIRELELARQQDPQTVRIHWDLLRAYTAAGRAEDAKKEKEEIEKLSLPDASR